MMHIGIHIVALAAYFKYIVQLQPSLLIDIGRYTHGTSILLTKLKSESAALRFAFLFYTCYNDGFSMEIKHFLSSFSACSGQPALPG